MPPPCPSAANQRQRVHSSLPSAAEGAVAGELGPPLGQQREWRGPAHSEARRAGQLSGVLLDPRVPEASLPVQLRAARLLVGVGVGEQYSQIRN